VHKFHFYVPLSFNLLPLPTQMYKQIYLSVSHNEQVTTLSDPELETPVHVIII